MIWCESTIRVLYALTPTRISRLVYFTDTVTVISQKALFPRHRKVYYSSMLRGKQVSLRIVCFYKNHIRNMPASVGHLSVSLKSAFMYTQTRHRKEDLLRRVPKHSLYKRIGPLQFLLVVPFSVRYMAKAISAFIKYD